MAHGFGGDNGMGDNNLPTWCIAEKSWHNLRKAILILNSGSVLNDTFELYAQLYTRFLGINTQTEISTEISQTMTNKS